MIKALFVAVAAVGMVALPASAQTTALASLNTTVPDASGVVSQCQLVANSNDDTSASGLCIGATQGYLDGISGFDTTTRDENIAELAADLALLVQDGVCNSADDEVARSIRLLSTQSTDSDQIARLIELSDTVAACAEGGTAALGADSASPA